MKIFHSHPIVVEVAHHWLAETFIQRHLKAMQQTDIAVHLVARHGNVEYAGEASVAQSSDGLFGRVMPNFDHLSTAEKVLSLRYLYIGKTSLSLRDRVMLGYFKRLKPDLIHFHDASLAAMMRWIPLALGIPYTLSLRGSDIQVLTLQLSEQREAILSAIAGAAKIHVVCQSLGVCAANLLGRALDFSVIYTTLPIPPVLSPWRSAPPNGQIHLISSGRLMWRKGFPDLLVALGHLRDQKINARLTIIGSGPGLDHLLYLRKMLGLESVVDFPGKLTYEQIQHLFGNAHAYVQSSVAEGLSNSLVEAMANGLPIFATDVDGTREVIEDGVSGFLLAPLTPQDWVEKLMLVYNGGLMEQVRAAAYEKAAQLFSAERHAQAFASFYREALGIK